MKKICIALDYSPTSQHVAEMGYAYARALNAEVLLVHVVSDAVYYMSGHDSMMGYEGFAAINSMHIVDELKISSQKYLDTTVSHLGDLNIETLVAEGEVGTEILDAATKWGADLIILGTHGHSFLENALMGNTAVNIVKQSEIPLLIIPVKKVESEYK